MQKDEGIPMKSNIQ